MRQAKDTKRIQTKTQKQTDKVLAKAKKDQRQKTVQSTPQKPFENHGRSHVLVQCSAAHVSTIQLIRLLRYSTFKKRIEMLSGPSKTIILNDYLSG